MEQQIRNKVNLSKVEPRPSNNNILAQFLGGIGSIGQGVGEAIGQAGTGIAGGIGQGVNLIGQGIGEMNKSPEGRLALRELVGAALRGVGQEDLGVGIQQFAQRVYQPEAQRALFETQQRAETKKAERKAVAEAEKDRLASIAALEKEERKRLQELNDPKNIALRKKYEAEAEEAQAQAKQLQMSPYENYRPADITTQQNIINDPAAIAKGIIIEDKSNPSNVFVSTQGDNYNKYVDQRRKETSEYKKQKEQTKLFSKKIDNMIDDKDVYKILGVRRFGPFNIKRESLAKIFGFSGEQMNDLANIKSISSDKFARLFADLRDPKTGATGFGSLSEAELEVVSNMLVNLEKSQSETQFKTNLQTLKDYMEERAITKGQELSESYDGIEVYTPNTSNLKINDPLGIL